jgi:hypothetical protein
MKSVIQVNLVTGGWFAGGQYVGPQPFVGLASLTRTHRNLKFMPLIRKTEEIIASLQDAGL